MQNEDEYTKLAKSRFAQSKALKVDPDAWPPDIKIYTKRCRKRCNEKKTKKKKKYIYIKYSKIIKNIFIKTQKYIRYMENDKTNLK